MTKARPASGGGIHDVARGRSTGLDTLFAPTSVAVIGTPEKAGRMETNTKPGWCYETVRQWTSG